MEDIFSPERLKLARQRRGLRQQELAARIRVSPRSIGRWERGVTAPKDDNLRFLAQELRFPDAYFFGDAPPTLEGWAFRSLARMTGRQRDTALAAGAQAVCLDLWLDTLFHRPKLRVPDLRDHSSPEDAAIALRAVWGLGYRPLPNVVHLMEANGIRVYSLVHAEANFDAFSVWYGGVPFVFLNTTTTTERRRMDACHEIGHLVLHAHTGGGDTKPENDEAAAFAAAFLMPAAPFVASAPQRITLASVITAKQQWGVSAISYVRRLHDLGRLTDWQYRSLCIRIRTQYHYTEEPGPVRAPEVSKVLAWVFSSGESGISRRDVVEHLQIPMSDLDEMTFGLTLTAVPEGVTGAMHPAMRQAGRKGGVPDLQLVE